MHSLFIQYYKFLMMEATYILGESTTANIDESKPKQIKLDNYTVCPDMLLGKGSFSSVYLCFGDDGKKAAVKILSKQNKKQQQIIKVAKAEVRILRKLKHPNIMGLINSYQSLHNYYILFDYCEGKTLGELIRQFKSLDLSSVINVTIGLIDAICYLQSKKIMHRDIKPQNVKYFKGKPTLIDFGFACQLPQGDKSTIKESVGTPSYMSPEMLQRKNYSFKSDIWSFGVLIYQITYGKLPWNGRSQSQLNKIITSNPLHFPATPKIPLQLKYIIESCLQIKTNERASAKMLEQFKLALENAQKQGKHQKKDDNNCSLFCWFD